MSSEPTLWDPPALISAPGVREGRYLTLQERYEEWRASAQGRQVVQAVAVAALKLRARGFTHYGIAALFEAARYEHSLRVGPDAEGFKLNNNWRSRLARDLMVDYPELAGMFELRELRA